jgi:hypothetical protein
MPDGNRVATAVLNAYDAASTRNRLDTIAQPSVFKRLAPWQRNFLGQDCQRLAPQPQHFA